MRFVLDNPTVNIVVKKITKDGILSIVNRKIITKNGRNVLRK